jgi:hypothetical protein
MNEKTSRSSRRQENKNYDFTHVKEKLSTFSKNSLINLEIQDTVKYLSKIVFETYHIANVYNITYMTQNGEHLEFNQMFYYRIMAYLITGRTKYDKIKNVSDTVINLRPINGHIHVEKKYIGAIILELSQQMEISSKNYIVSTFMKRLRLYIKLKYKIDYKDSYEFINRIFDTELESNKTPDEQELYEYLNINDKHPIRNLYGDNLKFYLAKTYEFLLFFESVNKCPTYTLLPIKNGYGLINITITTDGLWGLARNSGMYSDSLSKFKSEKEDIWSKFFSYGNLETKNRKFSMSFSTNGYEVSVRLRKPKMMTEETTTSNSINLSKYDKIIGSDPGDTFMHTSTVFTRLGTSLNNDIKTIKASTAHYKCLRGNGTYTKWRLNLEQSDDKYKEAMNELESFDTGNLVKYLNSISTSFKTSDYLFEFNSKISIRRRKFTLYINEQKALHKICKDLVGENTKKNKVIVGIGDWSRTDGVRGRHKAPIKKFKTILRTYSTVVEIDEYNTSKMCNKCGSKCDKCRTKTRTTNKTKKEETVERIRTKKCFLVHSVLQCSNIMCSKIWNRDTNGSINILNCLLSGEAERPPFLKRILLPIQRSSVKHNSEFQISVF